MKLNQNILHVIFISFVMSMLFIASHLHAASPSPLFVSAKGADNFKLLFISKTDTPPIIDGKIDDKAWSKVPFNADFGHCNYGARKFDFPKTEFKYLWDDSYLYFAFRCYEDSDENIAQHIASVKDKSKPVYERDCIELHIDGNNDNATKFQIWLLSTEEKQIFWYYDFGWGILVNENYGLSTDWDYKSVVNQKEKYWQIEGKIALDHIQIKPKEGYMFGMNPCRFRFGKSAKKENNGKTDLVQVSQFLTWSTQGDSHHNVRQFGKCILVENTPDTIKEGLTLAYSDLAKRKIMIQTDDGFTVLDKGKEEHLSYLNKLVSELNEIELVAEKFTELTKKDILLDKGKYYLANGKKSLGDLSVLKKEIAGLKKISASTLNKYRKRLGAIAINLDMNYWQSQRILLLNGDKTAVKLQDVLTSNLSLNVPAGRDEPDNSPNPEKRKIDGVLWGKKNGGEKIKALIITGERSSWEAYELKGRMNMDADIYTCNSRFPGSLGPDFDYFKEGIMLFQEKKEQLTRLLLKPHDIVILMDFPIGSLPVDIQYFLTGKLINGMPIVNFNTRSWNFFGFQKNGIKGTGIDILRSSPFRHFTYLAPKSFISNYKGTYNWDYSWESLPFKGIKDAVQYDVGKGKFLNFFPGGHTYYFNTATAIGKPQHPDELFQSQYVAGLAVKTVLAALGRLGPARVLEVSCMKDGYTVEQKAHAEVLLKDVETGTKLAVTIRNKKGVVLTQFDQVLDSIPKSNLKQIEIPALPAGDYYVDVTLLKKGMTLDWASQRFAVKGNCNIADIVRVDSKKQNESRRFAVTLKGDLKNTYLVAEDRDIHGRIIWKSERINTSAKGAVSVIVPTTQTFYTLQFLDVGIYRGNTRLDTKTVEFFTPRKVNDDFTVYARTTAVNNLGKKRREVIKDFGVDIFETENWTPIIEDLSCGFDMGWRLWLTHSRNDIGGSLASEPLQTNISKFFKEKGKDLKKYGFRFISTGDDSGIASDFVKTYPNWMLPLAQNYLQKYPLKIGGRFNRPEVPANFAEQHNIKTGLIGGQGIRYASLEKIKAMKILPGEWKLFINAFKDTYDNSIDRFNQANNTNFKSFEEMKSEDIQKITQTLSPDFMGFQQWLKAKYKNIAALNKAWGSSVAGFTEVLPKTSNILLSKGLYAAALDKTEYLEDLYINLMKSTTTPSHSVSPTIGIGQGACHINNIIPEFLEYADSYAPYLSDVNLELAASMPHRYVGQTLGVYGGKAVNTTARIQRIWHVLFTGGNFIWFWDFDNGGLMGDLSVNPNRSGAMLETIKKAKRGIASCLIRSERQNNGIAILHSRASGHMSGIVKELSTQESSESAFQSIVEDLNMQYRYISEKQLNNGILATDKYKILLLPSTQIISKQQAKTIISFVENGGMIIADSRTATFSEDGRALEQGLLDDLFGITRNQTRAKVIRGKLKVNALSGITTEADGFRADGSIVANKGEAFASVDTAPAFIINKVAKGYAVLLNIGTDSYDFLLNRNKLGTVRNAFSAIFAMGGAQSDFKVLSNGKNVPGVEFAVFKRGDIYYLTAEKKSFEFEKYPMKASIKLPKKYYITDMMTEKFIGFSDSIPLKFSGMSCHAWALMPYKTEKMTIKTPKKVKQGGSLNINISLKTEKQPGIHVVRIEIFSPSGKRLGEIRKLDVINGEANLTIPVAYNDIVGKWTIKAFDFNSGLDSKKSYKVYCP